MLLDQAADATAILAMSDKQALAILAEAHRHGVGVPGDLSVVGFDDAPDAAGCGLTTVAQPTRCKGRIAARMLFEDGPPRHEILPVKLVVRTSTASPRAP